MTTLKRDGHALIETDQAAFHAKKSKTGFQNKVLKELDELKQQNEKLNNRLEHVLNLLHELTTKG